MNHDHVIATSLLALCAGCVNGFQGSDLEFDFPPTMPVLAPLGSAAPGPNELPAASHFTLYAYLTSPDLATGSLFAVTTFEIHHIVDLNSPCYIDVGAHVPHPGLHVSQYVAALKQDFGFGSNNDVANPPPTATPEQIETLATAEQRERNIQMLAGPMGMNAVTSASPATYPPTTTNCTDTTGIPPPMCMDEASNAQRLAACQAVWAQYPDYYEGTDRVLTSPLNGTNHGMVDGTNPINLSPIGGAGFFVNDNLVGFDGYAVYWQPDDPTAPPGPQLLLYGTPELVTRGVQHVDLTSPTTGLLTAELAIFSNLGDDNEQF